MWKINRLLFTINMSGNGSPPQAWGKLRGRNEPETDFRFTPTGVGKIVSTANRATWHAVHPHRRGENEQSADWVLTRYGSPPQAWGKYNMTSEQKYKIRFTPTGVGKIYSPAFSLSASTVHPHRRGENVAWQNRLDNAIGSPPQAWGKCFDFVS